MNLIIKREQLYFVGLFLYVIRNFAIYAGSFLHGAVLTLLVNTALACWFFCMFMQRNSLKQLAINLFLLALTYINAEVMGSWNTTAVILMIIASKDISFKKIVRFIMRINITLLTSIILIYFACFIMGNATITQVREVDGEVVLRHQFFFNNANGFSMYFIFTVLMYVYVNYERTSKWKLYTILALAAGFIYLFPNTRTVCILSIVFILIDWLRGRRVGKVLQWICGNMFLVCFCVTLIFLVIFIKNPYSSIGAVVNKMMNGRLTMVAGALELYDLKLMGQEIINEKVYSPKLGYYKLYLDNFYGMLVIRYGIVMTVMFGYYFIKTGRRLLRDNQWIELLLFALVFIFGISESMALEIYPVFPLLFMRESIILDRVKNVRDKEKVHKLGNKMI